MRYDFDPLALWYPSKRIPVYARNGMVNCSSPMAAAAGLEALRKGGNAVDAVVAAAAALTVVEPTSNGVGSDAFAIVWSEKEKRLFGLNSSGPAPMLASADRIASDYGDTNGRMPKFGWAPVTVPGAPKAWAELSGRFGQLSLAETVAPAVSYARDGYPCAALLAREWELAYRNARAHYNGTCFDAWFKTFAPSGAPKAGDIICLPDLADTLEAIGESKADAFYTGEYARRIDEASRSSGGYIRYEDLASYQAEWVDPLRLNYRGYEVCEIPPNGQGITALIALNI
ncbi:MAG: gamma-glutamyltransferase, partial [Clostridia bacterium]|nr:gamma-glutamyltransferase [Clostridia bacterium]